MRRASPGFLNAHATACWRRGERVVCTVTGHGLKDPDWAISGAAKPTQVPPDAQVAAAKLGLA